MITLGRTFAAGSIIAASLVAASTAPAQAAFEQCDSGRFCGWGNNDYLWLIIERNPGMPLANHGGDANNEMDSWANRSTTNARGYDGYNFQGRCLTFTKGERDNNLAPWNSDMISSTSTSGGC